VEFINGTAYSDGTKKSNLHVHDYVIPCTRGIEVDISQVAPKPIFDELGKVPEHFRNHQRMLRRGEIKTRIFAHGEWQCLPRAIGLIALASCRLAGTQLGRVHASINLRVRFSSLPAWEAPAIFFSF
jgi:hypothetical protein